MYDILLTEDEAQLINKLREKLIFSIFNRQYKELYSYNTIKGRKVPIGVAKDYFTMNSRGIA